MQLAKGFHSLTFFEKTASQKTDRAPNTYKLVVRKLSLYKLKQKRTKKVKN